MNIGYKQKKIKSKNIKKNSLLLMSLFAFHESILAITLESGDHFALPVKITRLDDGFVQDGLFGMVLRDTIDIDPSGLQMIARRPNVTLRLSSLTHVPNDTESWIFEIPKTTDPNSEKIRYSYATPLARRGFTTFGMMTYPLQDIES